MRSPLAIASNAYDAGLALLYPQPCSICGAHVESRHDGTVCANCWKATRLFAESDTLCWKCGAFTRAGVTEDRRRAIRCGKCDDDAFTAARACGFYEGALRASILQLKREPHVPSRLGRLMLNALKREPTNQSTVIVPVPLHPDRETERGFNQAAILARELAQLAALPLDRHSIVRRLHTERHRAGMDARARRESVTNAFVVRHEDRIKGERILLVDDVFTTGATVSACAAALKDVGAAEVMVLTIARSQSIS